MAYKTIHTFYGMQRMAAAEAAGTPINLVAMAVGDGNGNPVTPNEEQTNLVREIAATRAAPNRIFQDPDNPLLFTAELIVPASLGGFVIREVGIFDDAGGLFAVANVPDTYKPTLAEGAFADTAIRMQFIVSNASVVTLQIDPNVAVATQSWIANTITLPYLLPGGTTGQYLAKSSNADGDVEWVDPTVANVVVTTVDEVQTLAASQTAINLAVCTTIGLAIYVEDPGRRLLPDDWTPHPTDITQLTLGASYPAGTKIYFVQNDPAAFVPTPLIQSKNLEDVPDKAAARGFLAVDSKANTDTHAPASEIGYFARDTAPAGWLKANGAAISRVAFSGLFAAIGTRFGAGDGFNTFNLPDLRGEFVRGWDDGRGVDNGRVLGTGQGSQNLWHGHGASTTNAGGHNHGGATGGAGGHQHSYEVPPPASSPDQQGAADGSSFLDLTKYSTRLTSFVGDHQHGIAWDGNHAHGVTISGDGGGESRPRNVAMLACIKF